MVRPKQDVEESPILGHIIILIYEGHNTVTKITKARGLHAHSTSIEQLAILEKAGWIGRDKKKYSLNRKRFIDYYVKKFKINRKSLDEHFEHFLSSFVLYSKVHSINAIGYGISFALKMKPNIEKEFVKLK